MPTPITPITPLGINHIRLTVTDVARSQAFYTAVLGFTVAREPRAGDDPATRAFNAALFGGVVLVANGIRLGLRPVAPAGDRFDEDRVGLDHLSFTVAGRADLARAVRLLDARGTPHGGIQDLGPEFGLHILAFRDPDNVQLELSAPYAR